MRWLFTVFLLFLLGASAEAQTPRYWNLLFGSAAQIQAGNAYPQVFSNDAAAWVSVRSVACYARGGTVTILSTLTGGDDKSILREPLVCAPNVWTAGKINGRPQVRSFLANGATCEGGPCTIDLKIEKVEGTPTYLLIKIVGR